MYRDSVNPGRHTSAATHIARTRGRRKGPVVADHRAFVQHRSGGHKLSPLLRVLVLCPFDTHLRQAAVQPARQPPRPFAE